MRRIGSGSMAIWCSRPARVRRTSPARSSTFTCFETALNDMWLDEVGYARGALRQPLDDLSARRVRERREGEVENRGRHIFNLWVEYRNWPALVKRLEVTPERPLAVRTPYRSR